MADPSREADLMLRTMGLSPTTVPAVLHNNRVPDKTTARRYREVEHFLLFNDLVNSVPPPSGQQMPGGWELLQISSFGYELVQNGESQKACQDAYQKCASLYRTTSSYPSKPSSFIEEEKEEVPDWWKQTNARTLRVEYDPDQEWPVWWSKYRLRRMWELFPNEDTFPVSWWEKKVDYLFRKRQDIKLAAIFCLIILGVFYALFLFYRLGA